MSQADVLRVLENNPYDWFTTLELAHLTNVNRQSVARAVSRLRLQGFAYWKKEENYRLQNGKLFFCGAGKEYKYRFRGDLV